MIDCARSTVAVPLLVEEEPDTRGELRLEGRVVDGEGQPVSGARVMIDRGRFVLSGEDGGFAFDDLAAGLHRLSARSEDRYADTVLVTLRDAREPVGLTMRRGMRLTLHVRDAGAPVAGARLVIDDALAAVTDEQGDAEILGIGGFWWVEVVVDGFARASVSSFFGPDDPGGAMERTIALVRGAALGGFVLGPGDVPVPDVTVRVWGTSGQGETSSDLTGAWRLDALPAGSFQLRVPSKTHAASASVFLELDGATPREDVIVRVEQGAKLVGSVADRSGQPLARPFIVSMSARSEQREELGGRGDERGQFELVGIQAGTYEVFAHDGHRLASPSTHVTLGHGETRRIDFIVDEGSIAGVLVDHRDEPVAGTEVRATADFVRGDVTDSRGRFELGAFPPGEYEVGAGVVTAQVAAGDTNVRLVLPPLTTLTGRVVLDGAPVPYYGALLTHSPTFLHGDSPRGIHDADGRFTMTEVPPGVWALVIAGPGTSLHAVTEITVGGGSPIDLGDIQLTRGQRYTGHVRDAAGAPVAGARVTIGHRDSDDNRKDHELVRWFHCRFETSTDPDGTFTFDGIPGQARTRITATHPERGSSVAAWLPEGDASIDFTLVETGAIEGVVHGPREAGSVWVQRKDIAAHIRYDSIRPDGTFLLDRLPPGEYAVWTDSPCSPMGSPVTVVVVANKHTTVELVAPPVEAA
jgi:hypothetical protein